MIAAAGALIIGLITALTVNERKEEIGVLLAVYFSSLISYHTSQLWKML
jgi:ABC-type antimicrobial peptide transport system permease subunit